MDAGTVSAFVDEMGDVGKNERAASKYSAMEMPGKIKNPDKQSPYGRQLLQGQEVEKEHKGTINWLKKNPDAPLEAATRSIASEHIPEDKKYYTHLKEMEEKYKTAMLRGLFDELQKIAGPPPIPSFAKTLKNRLVKSAVKPKPQGWVQHVPGKGFTVNEGSSILHGPLVD
jgi:hypothetical protein